MNLPARDLDTLVCFGMWAKLLAGRRCSGLKLCDVGFQIVQIYEKCRSRQVILVELHRGESIPIKPGEFRVSPREEVGCYLPR